jgi:hypothetical protein
MSHYARPSLRAGRVAELVRPRRCSPTASSQEIAADKSPGAIVAVTTRSSSPRQAPSPALD